MPTFDVVRLTAFSESSPRIRGIDTLQYHHAATTSLDDLENGMEPGGREMSANCALDTDGTLILKVPLDRRAFTSGVASYDQRCITVETVNTSGAPEWGISDASHRRLGKLAAEMYREGLLSGLFYGTGGIIGHRDVPGTYATACPGPSYDADLILKYASEYLNPPRPKEKNMPQRYQLDTDSTKLALAGFVGAACPGNWDEYTRNDKGDGNRAPYEFRMYGEARIVTATEWERVKKLYTTPTAVATVETKLVIDDATIAKLAKANAQAFFVEQKKAGN